MPKKENENNYLYSIGPHTKKRKMKKIFAFDWTICQKRKMKIIICIR